MRRVYAHVILVSNVLSYVYDDTRDLPDLTHSCPTRRSSDQAQRQGFQTTQGIIEPLRRGSLKAQPADPLDQGIEHAFPFQAGQQRSEEHTSELQSLMRISYAVFCLKKKMPTHITTYCKHIYYYIT